MKNSLLDNFLKKLKHKSTLLILATLSVAFVITAAVSPDFKVKKNIEIFFNLYRELNLFYVDEVDPDKLLADAAEGMTRGLDPYTTYLPESSMDDFEFMTTGKYGGIGSLIRKGKGNTYVEIAGPYKNSPADKAGLQIGDKILAVDGVEMKDADPTIVSNSMKGDPGSVLKLKIQRWRDDAVVEVKIKRERIEISNVTYSGFLDSTQTIGYIGLNGFNESSGNDVRNAFSKLSNSGKLKGLILDLRDNGGGLLDEAVNILGLFLPKGTQVVSTRGRFKEIEKKYATATEPLNDSIPLAVLIDPTSASASEIVAGAIQDLDRGVVIGQRSFGKGLVQTTRPTGYNTFLKVTTAKYYTPSGRCIQAINYSRRNEDGSIASIPDSLIREFKTTKGRKVYDGGGIMPDLKLEPDYYSIFTVNLFSEGYLEDFTAQYLKNHPQNETNPHHFSLTDTQYQAFVDFMQDKTLDYESGTEVALNNLKSIATKEKFIDGIQEQIQQIEIKIKNDKNANLRKFKGEIMPLLEDQILQRYHYDEGVLVHKLPTDRVIQKARELLTHPSQYHNTLTHNTARK